MSVIYIHVRMSAQAPAPQAPASAATKPQVSQKMQKSNAKQSPNEQNVQAAPKPQTQASADKKWKVFRNANVQRFTKDGNKKNIKTASVSKEIDDSNFVEAVVTFIKKFDPDASSDAGKLLSFKINNKVCNGVQVVGVKFPEWSLELKKHYAYYYIQLITQLITDCMLNADEPDIEGFNTHVKELFEITKNEQTNTIEDITKGVNIVLQMLKTEHSILKIPDPDKTIIDNDATKISNAYKDIVVGANVIMNLYSVNNEETSSQPSPTAQQKPVQSATTPAAQQTPAGAAGAPGAPGAAGAPGSAGEAGAPGAPGAPGAVGPSNGRGNDNSNNRGKNNSKVHPGMPPSMGGK